MRSWISAKAFKGRLRPCAAALLAGLFFAACTVGPDYVRPTAESAPGYKELDGWKRAEPQETLLRGAWWERFNDPQLNALEEKITISNQTVAAAEAQFRQARALVQQARAGYFPTVTLSPAYSVSHRSTSGLSGANVNAINSVVPGSAGAGGSASSKGAIAVYSLPVDATWDLDLWGRIRRSVESSRASAQASAGDLESARLSAQTELAQDYFQLRALDAQRDLLGLAVVGYAKALQVTQNRYRQGVAARSDVVQAEAQLKTTQAQLIDVGVQRAQLEHAVAVLIGTPPSLFSLPMKPLAERLPTIPVGLPSELLERRPDIAAAERRVAAANAQIGVAEAAYFPSITLTGAAGFQATRLSDWLSWPSRFWSLGTAISEVLFDGGSRRALTDQARAAYDAAVASYRETVLTGFQEVEDNLAALRILESEAAVQEEAVRASEESLAITLNQYKSGIVNYLQLVTVQQIALSNERAAAILLGNRMTAAVLLIKALGGGWDISHLPSARDRNTPRDTSAPAVEKAAQPESE